MEVDTNTDINYFFRLRHHVLSTGYPSLAFMCGKLGAKRRSEWRRWEKRKREKMRKRNYRNLFKACALLVLHYVVSFP